MGQPERLSDDEKRRLAAIADRELGIAFYIQETFWLAALWNEDESAFRPMIVTPSKFELDERLLLVKQNYRPKTFVPKGWDPENEKKIVTGSVDPKTGRVRVIVDPTKGEVQPAPIHDQINWKNVPPYEAPNPDDVPGWSKAMDDAVTQSLEASGLFRPESRSMAVRFDGIDHAIGYDKRLVPHALLAAAAKELHLRYPETAFDRKLSERANFQLEFERNQAGSLLFEFMRAAPADPKAGMLRTLIETGQLDAMPFKIRLAALLLSRGISAKDAASEIALDRVMGLAQTSRPPLGGRSLDDEAFKSFQWIFSEGDFQRCQSIVESLLARLMRATPAAAAATHQSQAPALTIAEVWKRFDHAWDALSHKQRKAAFALRMDERRSEFRKVAADLGIAVESLKDRWRLVQKRFRRTFPEFKALAPSKSHTRAKKGSFIYAGLYWHASAERVHPVTISRPSRPGTEVVIPKPFKGPMRAASQEIKRWLGKTREKELAAARRTGSATIGGAMETTPRRFYAEGDTELDLCSVYRPGRPNSRDMSSSSPADDDVATR